MEIKCDNCGAVAETVMPESVRDGDIEHTLLAYNPEDTTNEILQESKVSIRIITKSRLHNRLREKSLCLAKVNHTLQDTDFFLYLIVLLT